MLEKLASSSLACNRMARLSNAMAGCCGAAGAGLLGADELDELAEQLDTLEALQHDLAITEAALAEIEGAIAGLGEGNCQGAQGPWAAGMPQGWWPGTGAPGIGYGPRRTDDTGQTALKKTRVKNQPKPGPVIASWYFKGEQIKGESRRQLSDVVQASKDRAAEAISDKRIPRKYEGPVKKYFGTLEELEEK